ncbi:MAG: asparagine synthase-related protein, partial [Colwellia sp.]
LLSPIRYLKLLKNHFNSFNPKVIYRQLRALISVSGTTLFEKYFSLWRSNSCFNFLNNDAKNTGRSSFLQVTNNISSDNNYEVLRKFEIKYWLQSLLQVEDRCSMFASIESRVPILDHNLVELALSIPAEYCIDGGYNKKIFKDSFSEELPDWIKNAKNKSGYEVPIADWLALPEVKCFLDSCLLGKRKKFLSRFLQEDFNFDKLSARQVWMIGSLVIWAESNNVI